MSTSSEPFANCNKKLMQAQIEIQRQNSQIQILKEKYLFSQNKVKILSKKLKQYKNNEDINIENFTNVNNKKSTNNILIIFFLLFILFIFINFKNFKKKLIK